MQQAELENATATAASERLKKEKKAKKKTSGVSKKDVERRRQTENVN